MARYRVKKIKGRFYVQNRQLGLWFKISIGFFTSNEAIKAAQTFIEKEKENMKDNGKVVWESKE